jgi:hypothetical protein
LDGQQHVAVFGGLVNMSASPIWLNLMILKDIYMGPLGPHSALKLNSDGLTISENSQELRVDHVFGRRPVISPYLCVADAAVSAFTKEFRFEMPLDRLQKLKSVEARISSKPAQELNAK